MYARGHIAEETHLDNKPRLTSTDRNKTSVSKDGFFVEIRAADECYNSAMLLYGQLLILILLVILDVWLGIFQGAYFYIWWWDIPTHFLGGVWVGLFAAWFLQKRDKKFSVLRCAAAALSVGIAWEIFEYHFGLGGSQFMSYWADTIKDLCMDVLGGAIAGASAYLEKDLWQK